MTFKELRRLRRELEISQAEVAAALGTHQTIVGLAEKDTIERVREAVAAYLLAEKARREAEAEQAAVAA
ncbi:MAG: hypothetical protein KGH75_00495 [Rhodospirillales bacterium]|nr:hypothetical protein [Rhodospirillales bacterium]